MKRSYRRKLLRWIAGRAVALGWTLVRFLNWNQASRFGTICGNIIFFSAIGLKRIALHNIRLVYGDSISHFEQKKLAQNVFRNLARYLLQALKIMDLSDDEVRDLVDVSPGVDSLKSTFTNGRSAMILTGHYSNWELFAARISQIAPLIVLARVNDNPDIQRWIDQSRHKRAIEVIDRDNPVAVRALRRVSLSGGRIVGILMDQDTRVNGVFSRFLGHPAFTPSGPAAIALKDWFDVYVGFLEEQSDGRFAFKLSEKLELLHSEDPHRDVQIATDLFNDLIGKQIKSNPSQWVWIHRRWRRKPE